MAAIRFGLVGYGAWGGHHAAAIANADGAELVAVTAPSESSRERARHDHPHSRIYAAYREMLDREQLDVVDVVVPSYLHAEVGAAVLSSGRHLLMEKPMCTTVGDCQRLIELAEQHQRLLAVGFELRLSELWGKVQTMIQSGAIGRPLYCLIELWRRPYRPGASGWRFDISRVGNWILEEPIHFFDLASWYLGPLGAPQSVYALANSRQPDHPELQDNFSAMLKFPEGGYAVIAQTLSAFEHHQTAKITGTEGAIRAAWSGAMDRDPHPKASLTYHNGETTEEIPLTRPTGELFELQDEIAMMVRAVRDGEPVSADGRAGLEAVLMCEAAQASVDRGVEVRLADFRQSAGG